MTIAGDTAVDESFAGAVRRVSAAHASRTAIQYGSDRVTYAELGDKVQRAAACLSAHGVGFGDRVAVIALNSIDTLVAQLAPMMLGAFPVPVNTRLRPTEIAYILRDCDPSVLLVDKVQQASAEEASGIAGLSVGLLRVETLSTADGYSQPPAPAVGPEDPAMILYTSGTTGRPKGAVLTHRNLLCSIANSRASRDINSPDLVWMSGLPLFHIGGIMGPLTHLTVGAKSLIDSTGGFTGERAVDVLEQEGVTSCFFVPAQWEQICGVPGLSERLPRLRQIVWGGAPATAELLSRLKSALPQVEIHSSFGQTETTSATCVLSGADFDAKRGSAGRPVAGVTVRTVDESMADVGVGNPGEIVYRGPTVMREYWRQPEATDKAFRGGWFHSGDVGRFDADGYLWILSRLDDMIISGGENVYPAEVEAALLTHPAVADVAVAGIAHRRWGQVPVAFVVAEADPLPEQDMRAWCRERLASYKTPAGYVALRELPRNAAGKVLRRTLIADLTPDEELAIRAGR